MSKRKFYARPRWRNPGKAWEPRSRAQERRQKMPRAFTRRAEWRYGNNRTEAREARLKTQARRVISVGVFFERLTRRLFPNWKPAKIDPETYVVEV